MLLSLSIISGYLTSTVCLMDYGQSIASVIRKRSKVYTHLLLLLHVTSDARITALFKAGLRHQDLHLARRCSKGCGFYWKLDQRYI